MAETVKALELKKENASIFFHPENNKLMIRVEVQDGPKSITHTFPLEKDEWLKLANGILQIAFPQEFENVTQLVEGKRTKILDITGH